MTTAVKGERRMYGDLAWLWPVISSPDEYVAEAGLFARLVKRHSRIPVKSLLHLGCGAGHIDMTLKKHFDVTGSDVSGEMLGLARRLNPEVEYFRGDMRTLRLGRLFDAVIIADSITYMLSEKDLVGAFATAYGHLRVGGVFCTYAEMTTDRFEQRRTEVTTRRRGDVEVVFIENSFDPNQRDTTCELAFVYIIRSGGKLKIETDRHIVGLFRRSIWLKCLRKAGFKVTQRKYPGENIPVFVCRKPS